MTYNETLNHLNEHRADCLHSNFFFVPLKIISRCFFLFFYYKPSYETRVLTLLLSISLKFVNGTSKNKIVISCFGLSGAKKNTSVITQMQADIVYNLTSKQRHI